MGRLRTFAVPRLALLAWLLCPLSVSSAETLRQVVSSAIARFPEIQAAQHRQEVALAQVRQARAELFPTISGSFGEGRERSRNVSTRLVPGEEVSLSRREAEVTLTQLLFDGGAAGGQVRRATARAEGAGYNVSGTVEEVALRAAQAFIDVGRLREQLDIARGNIGVHEKTLSDVNALAEAGRGRRADVTQAEARRALAVSALEQLSGQLAQAEDSFRHVTGRPPGELAAAPALFGELPTRAQEAVNEALETHPVVQAAQKEVEAAQHDRESARARLAIPRVTIEAGASRNRDIDGIGGPNEDRYAMLRLRYNFFRGFGESARVRETEARIEEALATLAQVRTDIERDVRQAWDGLVSERARLPQLARYARASADVAEAYRLQFQLGQRSLLDVLNAENERYNAESGYIAARATVALNEMRLLASQGRLVAALGLTRARSEGERETAGVAVAAQAAVRCDATAVQQSRCVMLRMESELPERPGTEPSAYR